MPVVGACDSARVEVQRNAVDAPALTARVLWPVVEAALNLLSIEAHPRWPVDLVYEDADGPLYIEVEGTKNSIELWKGNQLLGYHWEPVSP